MPTQPCGDPYCARPECVAQHRNEELRRYQRRYYGFGDQVPQGEEIWGTWFSTGTTSTPITTTANNAVYYQPGTNQTWTNWNSVPTRTVTWDVNDDGRVNPEAAIADPEAAERLQQDRLAAAQEREADRERRRQERLERDREADIARERRRQEMAAARERAEDLLTRVLTPDQLERYRAHDKIVITGSDGRHYKIEEGVYANVYLLADGPDSPPIERWCAHPRARDHNDREIPDRDLNVGQILALRHDAPAFISRANLHWRSEEREAELLAERQNRRRLMEEEVAAAARRAELNRAEEELAARVEADQVAADQAGRMAEVQDALRRAAQGVPGAVVDVGEAMANFAAAVQQAEPYGAEAELGRMWIEEDVDPCQTPGCNQPILHDGPCAVSFVTVEEPVPAPQQVQVNMVTEGNLQPPVQRRDRERQRLREQLGRNRIYAA